MIEIKTNMTADEWLKLQEQNKQLKIVTNLPTKPPLKQKSMLDIMKELIKSQQ